MLLTPILAALVLVQAPQLVVTPDISSGDVITRERTIKVRVQSDSLVTQVEFYVGDELRDSATSTPYTFKLDPLNEKDGDLRLTFTAYTSKGDKASKAVTVKIDTGLSKGAAANTTIAEDYLTQTKWDDAIYAARVALKADPNYNPARLALARAYMKKGVYDKAQQFAEDALKTEPNSPEALELMSAIQLRRAFNSYATSDPKSVITTMADAIKQGIDSHRKVLESEFDRLPAPNDSNLLHYADVSIRTERYSAAISALTPKFMTNNFPSDLGDRIAYSQLRLGRFQDLLKTLDQMDKAKTITAYGRAILSTVYAFQGDDTKSDAAMTEALSDNPDDLGVRTAEAYIALRRNNLSTLTQLSKSLNTDVGQLPEANYYASVLNNRLHNYDQADVAFLNTVLAEPLSFFMYIERGNEALARLATAKSLSADQKQEMLSLAETMFQAAVEAKADSVEALTAMTIVKVLEQKPRESADFANAAVQAYADYAPAHYAAANVYWALQNQISEQVDKLRHDSSAANDPATRDKINSLSLEVANDKKRAQDELATAIKLDQKRLYGNEMPKVLDTFVYFYVYGPLPLVTPPAIK